jgi:Domain of unknown function (DUF5655)
VDESFAGRPASYRLIYDTLIEHLQRLGRVEEDAVKVGVFLSSERKFAEIRPMARSLAVWLILPYPLDSPRVARCERISADRFALYLKLTSVDEVDEELLGWFEDAYDHACTAHGR